MFKIRFDAQPVRLCGMCGRAMTLAATIPTAPRLPELESFRCSACGFRQTVEKEADEAAVAA
jgi:hypothetical protein